MDTVSPDNKIDTNLMSEPNSEQNGRKLLISCGTLLLQIQLPELTSESDFHLVNLILDQDGAKAQLNGYPIDLETGEPAIPINRDALLQAAENLANVWAEAGWKISKDHSLVQAAYENWLRAKTGHMIPARVINHPVITTPKAQGPPLGSPKLIPPRNRIVREDGRQMHPDTPIPPLQIPTVSDEELATLENCKCPGPCDVHPGAGAE